MKSGDTYRFSLSWPMDTEEQILAGEFLGKLGNKKSRFLIQLICDYISTHPEAMNPKETIRFIVNATSVSDTMTEMIHTIIKKELADKLLIQHPGSREQEQTVISADASIVDMLENLDIFNYWLK
jgi:hypothetical protein